MNVFIFLIEALNLIAIDDEFKVKLVRTASTAPGASRADDSAFVRIGRPASKTIEKAGLISTTLDYLYAVHDCA